MEAQTTFAELPEGEQPSHMGMESSQCVHWMVDYICDHREPVKLLLCKAEGTSYECFVHNIVEIEVEYTLQYLEVLHRLMDVNFWGTVNCCKFALPYLQQSHGSIVGISSVAGLHGLPGRTGYSASKYAMTGFLETLRIENLKKGLHVMIACPGFTASNVRFSALTADGTQQGATPRDEAKMMTPEEVARIVARGIQKRKRLCLMENEGRATHFVKKFAPGFLDRMFYLVMSREPDSPLK